MKKEIYSYLVKGSLIKTYSAEDNIISSRLIEEIPVETNILSYDVNTNSVVYIKAFKIEKIKNTWNLIKVNLSDNNSFICTPDTYILLQNNEYKKLRDLNILKDYPKSITSEKIKIKSISSITLDEKSGVYSIYLEGKNISNFELNCGIFIKSSKF